MRRRSAQQPPPFRQTIFNHRRREAGHGAKGGHLADDGPLWVKTEEPITVCMYDNRITFIVRVTTSDKSDSSVWTDETTALALVRLAGMRMKLASTEEKMLKLVLLNGGLS